MIYIDELFLFNAAVDGLLLFSAEKLCGLRTSPVRNAGAAVLGGGYAAAARLVPGGLPALPVVRIAMAAVLVLLACGIRPGRRLVRCTAVFLMAGALLGGTSIAVAALGYGIGRGQIALPGSSTSILLFGGAGAMLCATGFSGTMLHSPENYAALTVTYGGRQAGCSALLDSGNTLRDPLSGTPVIIAEKEALAGLWDRELERTIAAYPAPEELLAALADTPHAGRFRLVFCSTALGSGMLAAFRPDCAALDGREVKALIAISEKPLGEGGRFHALAGPQVWEEARK